MALRFGIFGLLLAAATFAGLHSRPARFVALFAAGAMVWTVLEYFLHRLAFHGFAPHSEHHAHPTDPVFIVAPLWLSLSSTVLMLAAFSLGTRSWTGGASMVAGVIAGYLAYEGIHLRIHSGAAGGPVLRALRKHHYYHHFASDKVCYGVTSPLWDLLLGSMPSPAERSETRSRTTA
ncbi:MAG TPA: sterol desaturase family protein [Bryobacteraceae bacterium]|jgi:sterol desaturase/sphingolipid hydroxylase (fatty acid hydroxylase superfamily)|nr:sterol desaturase family protein [Bryobacteraceae bacterium]